MPLPKCIKCIHAKREVFLTQDKRAGSVYICLNPEYAHLVTGLPIPCEQARAIEFFCDTSGKGYKELETQANAVEGKPLIVEAK